MNEDHLVRIPKAAKMLSISYSFLDRKIHEGKVAVVPMGRGRRITEDELNRIFIEGIE
jgi:excisionase family DNA binding protein